MSQPTANDSPVLIVGAGISGLLLAQHLRSRGVPFRVFERDLDLTTRGIGWGLTLHWSLPALRSLLGGPSGLASRLPEAYVDRLSVAAGESSRFPFYDLATGRREAETPAAAEADRVRVTREGLRSLLATGIDIEWGKAFRSLETNDSSIKAIFDDGSSCNGRLLVACDGSNSRVRRALFPHHQGNVVPIKLLGLKVSYAPQEIELIRQMDPFFLQGTSSVNNTFLFISILDAPGNNERSIEKYVCQICVSWPYRPGFFNHSAPLECPPTNEGKHELIQSFAHTWAEPFRTLIQKIPSNTEIKALDIQDFAPPKGMRTTDRAVLMGDAFHAMAMYRGEGANNSIQDVLDFAEQVAPLLNTSNADLRPALDIYEDTVVKRSRPAVLTSRRACLDAHDWPRINGTSPLLTRRVMNPQFDEDTLGS